MKQTAFRLDEDLLGTLPELLEVADLDHPGLMRLRAWQVAGR